MARAAGRELDASPGQRVETVLMATSRDIRRAYDLRLVGLAVNLTEASLLAAIDDLGPMTQTQLAERLGMGRASTGAVVETLQQRGFVDRRIDPADRRVWLVALTDDGRRLAGRVAEIDAELRVELWAGVGRADRSQLARTLARLHANLSAVLQERT